MIENIHKPILIADSGATKTSWRVIDNQTVTQFETIGMHPAFINFTEIDSILTKTFARYVPAHLSRVVFYGAGCSGDAGKNTIKKTLAPFFPSAKIEVHTDLLGACLALFGDEKGIASILGTGSNSAYFYHGNITQSHPSLGYILGDEGSGAYLGKKLVQLYLNLELPKELSIDFATRFNLDHDKTIEQVYKKPYPNRFLASLCPFLYDHQKIELIDKLIFEGLEDFFFKNLLKYEGIENLDIRFCGSIAYHFRNYIEQICSKHGLTLGKIVQNPIGGLVAYHKQQLSING